MCNLWRAFGLLSIPLICTPLIITYMRAFFTVVSIVGLGVLGGCSDKEASGKAALTGTRWMLVQAENFPVLASSYSESTRSYIQFTSNGRTEGLGPCNSFGGSYTLESPDGLRIGPQASTKIFCGGQGLETLYLEALPRTARYEIRDGELRLFDASNSLKPLLQFKAAE